MFYRGNKKAFFLSILVTALCKRAGVPLLDTDKKRRTSRASNSQAAAEADDEGGDDGASDDPLPTQSPLSSARAEEDLAAIRRKFWGSRAIASTSVQPTTTLELEMLRRQLGWEKKKNIERDRLMAWISKTLKVIFSCVAPVGAPTLRPMDFTKFPWLKDAWARETAPEDMGSNNDTYHS
ncbi:hypothetical protein KY284_016352 [Solanum tuberosum]|nr:hypothetical protein KY284_016352 [Solanum tuberosum]